MVSAIVLINTERNRINEVAEKLAQVDGITEVYSVAGEYDLVAIVRVSDNQAMADVVTGNMSKVEGITKTRTLIAFTVLSKHDLERMFSIGA
ncbi:MAG TPA: Lrp/AsnC ligand binding domain-containing protein [Desulfomonilia bacterium]|jgi:DNA-binding Lrp family transcriptional regulator